MRSALRSALPAGQHVRRAVRRSVLIPAGAYPGTDPRGRPGEWGRRVDFGATRMRRRWSWTFDGGLSASLGG